MEIWKPILEYGGHEFSGEYEVSSFGNVRRRTDKRHVPFYSDCRGQGYYRFKLQSVDGKRVAIKVHRLVGLSFVGTGDETLEINHIDGDAHNNVYTNLEFVTHAQNQAHRARLRRERNDA